MAFSLSKRKESLDIVNGPLIKNILIFILPLIATNLLQTFYHAADMAIVGWSGVEGAVGSIGITTSVVNIVLNFFIGVSVGATVLVARSIGSRNAKATGEAVHTSLCVSVVLGALAACIGFFTTRPILIYMGTEGRVLELANRYATICFAGAPLMSLANFTISIFRAKGDTGTPMLVLMVSGLCNVLLNIFFVLVCHMSVEGVALATLISQLLSCAVLLVILSRDKGWCRLRLRELRIRRSVFFEMLRIGLPAGVQSSLFSFSNLLLQSSIVGINNRMYPGGSAVLDGNAVGHSLDGFVHQVQAAVHHAAVTFTSQHVGAKKARRIRKVAGCCYLISFLLSVAVSGLILLLQEPIVGLYISKYENAAQVAQIAYLRNSYLLTTYFLLGFMDLGAGFLRGMGKSMTSTVISVIGICGFRISWVLLVLPHFGTLECLYTAYPLTWLLTGIVNFIVTVITWKKLVRRQDAEQAATA